MSSPSKYSTTPLFHRTTARLPYVRVIGTHGYSEIVNRYSNEPHILIAARLVAAFWEDFDRAATELKEPSWRLLDASRRCSVFALADPEFSAQQALRFTLEDVPPGKSAAEGVQSLRDDTILLLRQADDDVCKAIWVAIAAVQRLRLDLQVAPDDPWWSPHWLRECFPSLHHWDVIHGYGWEESTVSTGDDVDFRPRTLPHA